MLRMPQFAVRPRRALTLLAALALALVTVGFGPAGPAAADRHCWMQAVKGQDGTIHYVKRCSSTDPGHPGTPGPAEDCGQDQITPGPGDGPYFCQGGVPCAITTNVVPLALPTTDPPPGQKWQVLICHNGATFTKTWVLTGNQPRPLIVQAQEAFGNLRPPAGAVRHSPDTKAVVALPTWLWLDPGSFGVERGSSAEGLVAVAEPESTTWDPGDGTGTMTCSGPGTPYSTGASADGACTHTYLAMAQRYDGQVARHWVVHYDNGGARVDIPGAPLALTADTGFTLAVVEAQVVVGGN